MTSKYDSRVGELEKARGVKPDVNGRLAETERAIADFPERLQRERRHEFYLRCTDAELVTLMGIGPNPERWQTEALASGATVQEIKRSARDEVLRAKMKVETRKRINLSVIDGDEN